MPLTENELDWIDLSLSSAVYYLNQELRNQRLTALLQELEPMKFRITEDTFFLGQDRKVGEIMEAQVGPYRYEPGAGKLDRFPQFEEIKETMTAELPPVSLTAEKPPAPKAVTKLTELAQRINKFHKSVDERADALAKRVEAAEPKAEQAFAVHHDRFDQAEAQFKALEDSLHDLAGANGGPLED